MRRIFGAVLQQQSHSSLIKASRSVCCSHHSRHYARPEIPLTVVRRWRSCLLQPLLPLLLLYFLSRVSTANEIKIANSAVWTGTCEYDDSVTSCPGGTSCYPGIEGYTCGELSCASCGHGSVADTAHDSPPRVNSDDFRIPGIFLGQVSR